MVNAIGFVNYPAGNVYAHLRNKYGVGPEDFGTRPYLQPYPKAIQPLPPEPPKQESGIAKVLKHCYA